MLARVLDRLSSEKPRARVVHVWGPPPTNVLAMAKPVASLRRRGLDVRWTLPRFDAGIGGEGPRDSAIAGVVREAVRGRARASREKGERVLRRLGVRVIVPRALADSMPAPIAQERP